MGDLAGDPAGVNVRLTAPPPTAAATVSAVPSSDTPTTTTAASTHAGSQVAVARPSGGVVEHPELPRVHAEPAGAALAAGAGEGAAGVSAAALPNVVQVSASAAAAGGGTTGVVVEVWCLNPASEASDGDSSGKASQYISVANARVGPEAQAELEGHAAFSPVFRIELRGAQDPSPQRRSSQLGGDATSSEDAGMEPTNRLRRLVSTYLSKQEEAMQARIGEFVREQEQAFQDLKDRVRDEELLINRLVLEAAESGAPQATPSHPSPPKQFLPRSVSEPLRSAVRTAVEEGEEEFDPLAEVSGFPTLDEDDSAPMEDFVDDDETLTSGRRHHQAQSDGADLLARSVPIAIPAAVMKQHGGAGEIAEDDEVLGTSVVESIRQMSLRNTDGIGSPNI